MAPAVALQLPVLVRAQGVVADGVLLQADDLLVAVVVLDDVAVVFADRVADVFAVVDDGVVLHLPVCGGDREGRQNGLGRGVALARGL